MFWNYWMCFFLSSYSPKHHKKTSNSDFQVIVLSVNLEASLIQKYKIPTYTISVFFYLCLSNTVFLFVSLLTLVSSYLKFITLITYSNIIQPMLHSNIFHHITLYEEHTIFSFHKYLMNTSYVQVLTLMKLKLKS